MRGEQKEVRDVLKVSRAKALRLGSFTARQTTERHYRSQEIILGSQLAPRKGTCFIVYINISFWSKEHRWSRLPEEERTNLF